jgi:hypothetical protein
MRPTRNHFSHDLPFVARSPIAKLSHLVLLVLALLASAACGDAPGAGDEATADAGGDLGDIGDAATDADADVRLDADARDAASDGVGDGAGAWDGDAADLADTGADLYTGPRCLSTAGCNAEPGYEGLLCVDEACVRCASDGACADTAVYGLGATCEAGRCTPCTPGEAGCACDAGSCVGDAYCAAGVCIGCAGGELDCPCNDDGTCDLGGRCGDDDYCEVCPDGELACLCLDDPEAPCGDGLECLEGLCAPETCEPGEAGCPCVEDACDAGAGCHEDAFCYACDADAVGCTCDPDEGCVGALACDAGDEVCRVPYTCDDLDCAEHQLCAEPDDEDNAEGADATCLEACEAGYRWDAGTEACALIVPSNCIADDPDSILDACADANRECVAGADAGSDASCGECAIGWVEDDTTSLCRAPLTCVELGAACLAEHRACVDGSSSTDATCGACLPPFAPTSAAPDAECVVADFATCEGADEYSYLAVCAAQDRLCVKEDGVAPTCGGCRTGYTEDAGGVCTEVVTCDELACGPRLGRDCSGDPFATCGACLDGLTAVDPGDTTSQCLERITCADLDCGDAYCFESATGGAATCGVTECGANQAFHEGSGACVSCGASCAGLDGATGRFWPYTTAGGSCVCETELGYFSDPTAANLPQACDTDGDGWVRIAAESAYDEAADPAIAANARCDVRTIDRVTLQNELLQRRDILLCHEGLVPEDLDATCTPAPIDLYEDAELDSDEAIAADLLRFPRHAHGGVGRSLTAAELTPLTRLCTADGDFNSNGVADVEEGHGLDPGTSLTARELAFMDFGFYLELHRSWYEERPLETYGAVVIAERSRCDDESADVPFPLSYSAASGDDYWRSCTRNRRADFDVDRPAPGYDFARWSCDDTDGSCAELPPPTDEVVGSAIPAHGLCDAVLPPEDGVWRGMNHHSQFRCVVLADSPHEDYELAVDAVYDPSSRPSARYDRSDCCVACADGDETCADTSEDPIGERNPRHPILGCTAASETPEDGDATFVSTRYVDAAPSAVRRWSTWARPPRRTSAWARGASASPAGSASPTGGSTQAATTGPTSSTRTSIGTAASGA